MLEGMFISIVCLLTRILLLSSVSCYHVHRSGLTRKVFLNPKGRFWPIYDRSKINEDEIPAFPMGDEKQFQRSPAKLLGDTGTEPASDTKSHSVDGVLDKPLPFENTVGQIYHTVNNNYETVITNLGNMSPDKSFPNMIKVRAYNSKLRKKHNHGVQTFKTHSMKANRNKLLFLNSLKLKKGRRDPLRSRQAANIYGVNNPTDIFASTENPIGIQSNTLNYVTEAMFFKLEIIHKNQHPKAVKTQAPYFKETYNNIVSPSLLEGSEKRENFTENSRELRAYSNTGQDEIKGKNFYYSNIRTTNNEDLEGSGNPYVDFDETDAHSTEILSTLLTQQTTADGNGNGTTRVLMVLLVVWMSFICLLLIGFAYRCYKTRRRAQKKSRSMKFKAYADLDRKKLLSNELLKCDIFSPYESQFPEISQIEETMDQLEWQSENGDWFSERDYAFGSI